MALIQCNFFSSCLNRTVPIQVVLPTDKRVFGPEGRPALQEERPLKTLYLLHGLFGNYTDWVSGTRVQAWAQDHDLAVVCPSGDNSFYVDNTKSGNLYSTFIGQELVEFTRRSFPLSRRREDTFIGGLSMGGFGALHTAFAFPENFGKVAAMSSALLIHEIAGMKPGQDNGVANYEYYHLCFGDLDRVEESDANPETLVLKLKSENKEIPGIYMACGTEDFLLERNRAFCEFLKKEEIPVLYEEGPGSHNMQFWDAKLEPAIKWMLGN